MSEDSKLTVVRLEPGDMVAGITNHGNEPLLLYPPERGNDLTVVQQRPRSTLLVPIPNGDGSVRSPLGVEDVQTELRPPLEHADKRLHWVEKDSVTAVWQWDNGVWSFGRKLTWPPDAPYCKGYRYLGPAEWAPADDYAARIATLEAQNARLLQQVADLEAVRGAVPFRATTEPTVTPEMVRAGVDELRFRETTDYLPGVARAVYLAMEAARALEPMPVTPGLWSDDSYRALLAERDAQRQSAVEPSPLMSKSAAFEVRRLSDGAMMAVHANGRIEGFPPDYTVIVNRIPFMLWAARLEGAPAPTEPEPLGPHLTALRGLP